ncbi:MAG: prepilin-type N-terminal cleavage/methylation domain-containing protein [Sterolibacterium sp.]|nr:prepilin-type N-terminal cleavage/methylation domain-containing protein [Sterolibacterium sp.]
MKQNQQGFTLIELIIVIVILGILAAVAMPKFVDLSGEAEEAALQGVAGSISSAMTINYAANKIDANKGTTVSDCLHGANVLDGGLPTGYSITTHTVSPNTTYSDCELNYNSKSAKFTAIGTPIGTP